VSCTPARVETPLPTVTTSLRAIATAGTSAWAVGDRNTLLKLDTGAWTKVTAPTGTEDYDLRDVHLIDAQNGWAVGSWNVSVGGSSYVYGMGLKLSAGTWTLSMNSLAWGLNSIDLVDAQNGWAVGRSGQFVRIVGGAYTPGTPGNGTTLNAVDVIDMNTGWAVGEGGTIRKLASGTWTTPLSPTSQALTALVLSDANTGWAVGAAGTILRLSGGTWTVVAPAVTNQRLTAVGLASDGSAWAVGEQGVVLRNTGAGWQQCDGAGTASLRGLSVSGTERWAVGDSGHRRQLLP
jgi:hypothetical protein